MKPIYPFALLGALFAIGAASAATTTPVGYITLNLPANSDATVVPSLQQSALLSTAATGISGSVISFSAPGIAAGDFINGTANAKTYVLIKSGLLAGLRFPVSANAADSVTVEDGGVTLQSRGFAADDLFEVVPYWTLQTLFPDGEGVGVSSDIFDPQAFVVFSNQTDLGVNRGAAKLYFYSDGSDGEAAGWYDNDDPFAGLQNDVAIDPSVMMTIRTGSVAQQVIVTGQVAAVPLATVVVTAASANDELLGSPYPVDISLQDSGLQSVVTASTDIFDPVDFVFVYNDEASGLNKGASKAYFYHGGADGEAAGWYDNDDPFAGIVTDEVIKAGRSFVIRKTGGAPGASIWSAPLPYTP